MKRIVLFCVLFVISMAALSQEAVLVVRYEFQEKASPPMKIFYIKVFVDGVFADSTKPHMPHHNLANAVRTKIAKGSHHIKIEGWVREEKGNSFVISNAMDWSNYIDVTQRKCRIAIKMNSLYEVVVSTITDY